MGVIKKYFTLAQQGRRFLGKLFVSKGNVRAQGRKLNLRLLLQPALLGPTQKSALARGQNHIANLKDQRALNEHAGMRPGVCRGGPRGTSSDLQEQARPSVAGARWGRTHFRGAGMSCGGRLLKHAWLARFGGRGREGSVVLLELWWLHCRSRRLVCFSTVFLVPVF